MEQSVDGFAQQQKAIDGFSEAAPMVTDSRYFSNEFNTAIIDGPLRIYFTDRQEAQALQIYFEIQEAMSGDGMKLDSIPMEAPHMFLMLYPSAEAFKIVFQNDENMAFGKFGKNLVMGISGPCAEGTRKLICNQVKSIFADAAYRAGVIAP